MKKTLAAIVASAALVAGAGVQLASTECVDALAIKVTDGRKEQVAVRICGAEKTEKGEAQVSVPEGVQIIEGTASAPYEKLLGDSKELTAVEVKSPCACADYDAPGECEVLTRGEKGEETLTKAPLRMTFQPGTWRNCVISPCSENVAVRRYPGDLMADACKPPELRDAVKPAEEKPAAEEPLEAKP